MVVISKEWGAGKQGGVEGLEQCRVEVFEIIENDDFPVRCDVLDALIHHFTANYASD